MGTLPDHIKYVVGEEAGKVMAALVEVLLFRL
jgi:hypothetical protein